MKTSHKLVLILTFVLFALTACMATGVSTPAQAPTQASAPTQAPTQETVPTPTAALSDACPTPASGTKLLTNTDDGYCLLYPEAATVSDSHLISLIPVQGGGDLPEVMRVMIYAASAGGQTVSQIVDAQVAAAGSGYPIQTAEVLVGGEKALVVDGLPGQDAMREVFVVHNDRFYTFMFTPWDPRTASQAQLEALYQMVLDTFHFCLSFHCSLKADGHL